MRPPKNVPTVQNVLPKILPMMSLEAIEMEMMQDPTDEEIVTLIEEAWCIKYLEMQTNPLRGEPVRV
jgi:hypothetical protein